MGRKGLLSPPTISTLGLQKALEERGVFFSYDECEELLLELGMLDPIESEDHRKADKSLWAELYSYRVFLKTGFKTSFSYAVLRTFELLYLEDLLKLGKEVIIPNCLKISHSDSGFKVKLSDTDAAELIRDILSTKKLHAKFMRAARRETRYKLHATIEEFMED